jgi:thioredoxin-dependent peroxiredoxin
MKSVILLSLFLMSTLQTQAQQKQKAPDFTASTIDGKTFNLSDLKGKKIHLSFYRNGACALCNLRVHEISMRQKDFDKAGIQVVAVFESSIEDMKPYVGQQKLSFTLLSDPQGKLYELFGVKNSPEIVNTVISSGSAKDRITAASQAGFNLVQQANANFFRIPAEVLINQQFEIVKTHHCDQLINHLPIDEVLKF